LLQPLLHAKQEAAHRQAAATQDDAGATMSVLQGKVHALEGALADAHATVSNSCSLTGKGHAEQQGYACTNRS
jgi:hypothetical protein